MLLQLARWDGDCIVGGEPDWFKAAAREGRITRSAEGVGSVLLVATAAGLQCAMPGDALHLSDDGTPAVVTRGMAQRPPEAAPPRRRRSVEPRAAFGPVPSSPCFASGEVESR